MVNLYNNLTDMQKGLLISIVAVLLYIASAGISYTLFGANLPGVPGGSSDTANIPEVEGVKDEDPSLPRNEVCPLDGELHTKPAKEKWEKRRPLAVMIENHQESRPQSGLSYADVIYEAVAEGGITRFMAVYLCSYPEVQVGPVRSARTYFLDWLSEYDALYAHVGGANTPGPADALGQIIRYDIKDLNQFSIGFPTFWRDYQRLGRPVATEHTMYSSTEKLWATGEKKGWTASESSTIRGRVVTGPRWDAKFIPWKFKDDAASTGGPSKIEVNFWENQKDYKVEWNYDSGCNCYKRKNAGVEHTDLDNKKQLSPKNVVVRFMKESRANDGYEGNAHLLYGNIGKGNVLIFIDGKVIKGTWNKANRLAREKFLDDKGQEIEFNRGQVWLQTVPEGAKVSY